MDTSHTPRHILLGSSVKDVTGFSRVTLHRLVKSGEFPAPVRLSSGRIGWFADEIADWQAALPRATESVIKTPVSPGRNGRKHDGRGV